MKQRGLRDLALWWREVGVNSEWENPPATQAESYWGQKWNKNVKSRGDDNSLKSLWIQPIRNQVGVGGLTDADWRCSTFTRSPLCGADGRRA